VCVIKRGNVDVLTNTVMERREMMGQSCSRVSRVDRMNRSNRVGVIPIVQVFSAHFEIVSTSKPSLCTVHEIKIQY
jgi:hypothetical protein